MYHVCTMIVLVVQVTVKLANPSQLYSMRGEWIFTLVVSIVWITKGKDPSTIIA